MTARRVWVVEEQRRRRGSWVGQLVYPDESAALRAAYSLNMGAMRWRHRVVPYVPAQPEPKPKRGGR